MIDLTNTSKSSITLASGREIGPGESVSISENEFANSRGVCNSNINRGALRVGLPDAKANSAAKPAADAPVGDMRTGKAPKG